jgi:hypothetical protein
MVVEHVGDLEGFFEVYASKEARANVLSFAAEEDKYEVMYNRGEGFSRLLYKKMRVCTVRNKYAGQS